MLCVVQACRAMYRYISCLYQTVAKYYVTFVISHAQYPHGLAMHSTHMAFRPIGSWKLSGSMCQVVVCDATIDWLVKKQKKGLDQWMCRFYEECEWLALCQHLCTVCSGGNHLGVNLTPPSLFKSACQRCLLSHSMLRACNMCMYQIPMRMRGERRWSMIIR